MLNNDLPFSSVEKIHFDHDTDTFDCGQTDLNRFLSRFAFVNHRAHTTQTYVVYRGLRVVGYYSLTVGHADRLNTLARVTQGMAQHPVPLMILARLAVDKREQGGGLGAALLKDALRRSAKAAD